ncbi:ATP-binding protein [Pandoraea communis]|uniref:ATPase n=1 Tax=Pandoraea communis TaxID=2508297 RepID=A0A5E4Y1X3_9BURK|nr:ATP-binding protein [Pandoraea communis]MDM8358459.1 ATP-binding protein [Pandoraea communis]VVE42634.1 ATPase [Pandoraea communis]
MTSMQTDSASVAATTPQNHGAGRVGVGAGVQPIRSVADTGIPLALLVDLVGKVSLQRGSICMLDLMAVLKLPLSVLDEVVAFAVRERLMEITHRGALDADVSLRLTDAGTARARESMARCSYAGPAPVTLEDYVQAVHAVSVRHQHVNHAFVKDIFRDTTLDARLLDEVASSLNAGRPLMLFGPAGSGKTYLAERLGLLLEGLVPVPFAVCVDSEIIQVFDPLIHEALEGETLATVCARIDAAGAPSVRDRRWQWCKRPVVVSGGELTLDMLEVSFDAAAGFYQAPPHLKANGGIYIIDDFGRQLASPQALANRWIMPLDRNVDVYTLHTGQRFTVPFDVWTVFSSNLNPWEACDEAFLRRLGCKLFVGPVDIAAYRRIFDAECHRFGMSAEAGAFAYLASTLHGRSSTPLMACYPRDLLALVDAECRYKEYPKVVTADRLDEAWRRYFDMTHRPRRHSAGTGPAHGHRRRGPRQTIRSSLRSTS